MTDSLHLVGDGDDVEVVEWVERVFGISISNRETQETLTVGQLFDLIEAKCGTSATEMCLSQVAFYRLRRALRELGAASAIEPATPSKPMSAESIDKVGQFAVLILTFCCNSKASVLSPL